MKTIYDGNGNPLTDFRASVVRSFLLNDFGEAIFYIATSDPKCKSEYLKFGNFIVVQHEKLNDWVGVIDTPRIWHNGYVEVHAFEVPYLLKYRLPILNSEITGTPGERFSQLIGIANSQEDTLLRAGSVTSSGYPWTETLTDTVYGHIRKLSVNNGHDWVCSPSIGSNGSLSVVIDWLESAGRETDLELSQGKNVLYGDVPLEESGELLSHVEAVSDLQEGGVLIGSYSEEMPYGLRSARYQFNGTTDVPALNTYARQKVIDAKTPTIATPLTVVDFGNTFYDVRLGNVVRYKYTDIGFDGTGLGVSQFVRIEGYRFDESTGACELFTGKPR